MARNWIPPKMTLHFEQRRDYDHTSADARKTNIPNDRAQKLHGISNNMLYYKEHKKQLQYSQALLTQAYINAEILRFLLGGF